MMRYLLWLGVSIAAVTSLGCGKGATCESLCSEAQAGKCTNITGDCGIFCASLQKVTTEGSCQTKYDNYDVCVSEGSTCSGDSRCSGQKNALSNCVGSYCLGHLGDTDCQTIGAALK